MTGTVERDEESVFLFVREKATVYLLGEQNWRENQAERDRCCVTSLMLLLIVHSVGCHVVFYDVCFDAFIFPK